MDCIARTSAIVVVAALLAAAPLAGQLPPPARTAAQADVEGLTALLHRYDEARLAGKVTLMEPLLAVDFTGITGNGTVLSKDTMLEGLASQPADSPSGRLERDQIEVRLLEGDGALVTSRTIARGTRPDGSDFTNITRIATVCVRRDGRWQIFAFVAMPR